MTQHCGFVAVLGATNAGKSTLVNRLVGAKVSIVSPKVQTTRSRIRGIFVEGDTQVILTDTPGVFNPSRRLDRAMVVSAFEEAGDSDLRLLVIDVKKGLTEAVNKIITHLSRNKLKAILVLNKTDLIQKEKLLPLIAKLNHPDIFSETFLISAQNGEGVAELRHYLATHLPEQPWQFDADQMTDLPNRLFAGEVTREKLFLYLGQELPYAIAVDTTAFKETEQAIRIEQTIYVQKAGQKAIVIGAKGAMLKKIGQSARQELTRIFEKKVNLFLFVKVKENWSEDRSQFDTWGLDYNA